jgi:hypothetical protein
MGRYWRLIGHYDAETQTYSACAGAFQTSPYTPDETARLIGLRTVTGRAAATTLTGAIQFRLTCTTFKPNTIHAVSLGTGLQTAPAFPGPVIDYQCDQSVSAGVPITVEARCFGAADVTNDVALLGLFQS